MSRVPCAMSSVFVKRPSDQVTKLLLEKELVSWSVGNLVKYTGKSIGESKAVFLRGVGGDAATEPRRTGFGGIRKRNFEEEFRDAQRFDAATLKPDAKTSSAWKHPSAKAVGRPSEFGECVLSVAPGGSNRRGPRRQAETVKNLASDGRILDGCQNAHPRAAARGGEWGFRWFLAAGWSTYIV